MQGQLLVGGEGPLTSPVARTTGPVSLPPALDAVAHSAVHAHRAGERHIVTAGSADAKPMLPTATAKVLTPGYGFQVARIDALPNATQMVEVEAPVVAPPVFDVESDVRGAGAMQCAGGFSVAGVGVDRPIPDPAARVVDDVPAEVVDQLRGRGRSVAHHSPVMALAEPSAQAAVNVIRFRGSASHSPTLHAPGDTDGDR
jgi:hypothetical protein